MNKLSNNNYFREVLQKADENKLTSASIYYVPFSILKQSLMSNEEFFYDWLVNNYAEFDFSETEDTSIMHSEICLFLTTQTREEKLLIYRDFMTSYGMIEDLMCLNIDERQEFVIELEL